MMLKSWSKFAAMWISSPFTVDEAQFIFGGNFHTSPVGLIEKHSGDSKWHMIHHLSKYDSDGLSTNGWLNSDDFPTVFYWLQ